MSSITLVVLGLLGLSTGIPVEKSFNPQDFYQPSSSRIVGGSDAPEGSALHMVALVSGEFLKSLTCGAALVSPNCVLTAAHCIDALRWIDGQLLSSLRGQIGSNSLSGGYSTIRFSGYENHPDWDMQLIKNDVGVMQLTEFLPKNALAKPIKLNFKMVGGEESVHVTGWGSLSLWGALPDRLQLLRVETLSPKVCEEWMRKVNAVLSTPPVHAAVELCTTHELGAGKGMCHGDSGSAVVDSQELVVGVVSWGVACARGVPDVHARISGFEKFLRAAMARAGNVVEE